MLQILGDATIPIYHGTVTTAIRVSFSLAKKPTNLREIQLVSYSNINVEVMSHIITPPFYFHCIQTCLFSCPAEKCSESLPPGIIRAVLGDEAYGRWERLLFEVIQTWSEKYLVVMIISYLFTFT